MAAAIPSPTPPPSSPPSSSSQSPSSLRRASARMHQAFQVAGIGIGLGVGASTLIPGLARHAPAFAASFWAALSLQNGTSLCFSHSPGFGSLSLGLAEGAMVEQKTGVEFPPTLPHANAKLAGTGLRTKSIFGMKNIVVYAFGVYADEESLCEKLGAKYAATAPQKLQEEKGFYEDVVKEDISMAVRLVIVYNKLKIGSVRSGFTESVGNRIQKFCGFEDKKLLQRFTSIFKDEFKLPRGTTVDIVRSPGHVLHTRIDGKEAGSVESEILCRAFFDLYIGDEPFDKDGKLSIGRNLASMLQR